MKFSFNGLIMLGFHLFNTFMTFVNDCISFVLEFNNPDYTGFFFYILSDGSHEMCIRHFILSDFPIHFNSSIEKIEIKYKYNEQNYRYVERNPYNAVKVCDFPKDNDSSEGPIGPKGIINCLLTSTCPISGGYIYTDITSLVLEYQGPLKDFHGSDLRVRDIRHPSISSDSFVEILDSQIDTHLFKYDDLIEL
jgi:hypothetical protein